MFHDLPRYNLLHQTGREIKESNHQVLGKDHSVIAGSSQLLHLLLNNQKESRE